MRVRNIYFGGIGIYLPEAESAESAVARGLYPADQVAARGYRGATVAGETPAPEMALSAARDALKNSGVSPGDLAALLYTGVWHQGPEGWSPLYYLQRYLVGDDLLAAEVRHGCNGTFSAIELAIGVLRIRPDRKAVLVVASDNFGTRLVQRWNSGANGAVMGDGAGAVVLTNDDGFAELRSICTMSYSDLEEAYRGGEPLFPPSITEGRTLDYTARNKAYVAKVMAEGTGPEIFIKHQQCSMECANRALADAEVKIDDIKQVVVHNWGWEETEAYLGVLGFPVEKSTWHYGSGIGHVGAGDHMISLHHLLATSQVSPGDHVLLVGILPGASYKAAVIQIRDVPSWASSGPS
jgi:3-oxoacyl-[acyl-carrier-protein] synthase-3/clorobiocin biosynthesis protein CloN2